MISNLPKAGGVTKSIESRRAERVATREARRQAKLAMPEKNILKTGNVGSPETDAKLQTDANNSMISPVPPASPLVQDMNTAVAQDRAGSSPDKTEVTSPELGKIANEASDHNAKLDQLIGLFQQVLTTLKPQSQPIRSIGSAAGVSASNEVVHQPANYMRSTIAPIAKSSGKAVLNVGVPNA